MNRKSLLPTQEDRKRCAALSTIPGWSGPLHYAFFRQLLDAHPVKTVLMLGVYHGRDLAFLADIKPTLTLVGVDLFSAGPCADWPKDSRDKTWEQMGFGPNPDAESARRHVPSAEIVASGSVHYMASCGRTFDLIYFDTSHDYNTLMAELSACRNCCHEHTLLAGDDFAINPGWGVIEAVNGSFSDFDLYAPIWVSSYEKLV